METTDIVVRAPQHSEVAVSAPRTAKDIIAHVRLIEEVKAAVMKESVHFGTIPGCGDKPTLLKPGAEKLLMTFQLCSDHDVEMKDLGNGHREYLVKTPIRTPNGILLATGLGSCSTMESKYRWRDSSKKCPACGKAAIIKGKEEYGGGWICFKKKDGCGAKFNDGDQKIESQSSGRVENADLADTYNTVLKMAKKRSMVDGTLAATGSSDFFAQDLEDLKGQEERVEKEEKGNVETWLKKVSQCETPDAIKAVRVEAWGWIAGLQDRNRITAACVKRAEELKPREQPGEDPFPELGDAEPPAASGAAPAATDKTYGQKGARSYSGLTKAEWEALPASEQTARGDISKQQLVAIGNLARKIGLDEAAVMQSLRTSAAYRAEFETHGMGEYWQLSATMASATISQLSAG